MKFTHSLVIGVLFGLLSISDVTAIKLQESESAELMASIDVDLEQLHKKHSKHHKKAKKHHRRSHTKVQTGKEDNDSKEDATPVEEAPKKKKEETKKEETPKTTEADREAEVTKRAEKNTKFFKEKSDVKKEDADDATTKLENARKNANETFDDIKA